MRGNSNRKPLADFRNSVLLIILWAWPPCFGVKTNWTTFESPFEQKAVKSHTRVSGTLGLNENTYQVYFDLLLQMTISAISVCSVRLTTGAGPLHADPEAAFQQLPGLIRCFGELIDLYSQRIQFFSRRLLSIVLNSSKNMLAVSANQAQEYVCWRNAQQVP